MIQIRYEGVHSEVQKANVRIGRATLRFAVLLVTLTAAACNTSPDGPVERLSLSPDPLSLFVGDTVVLRATLFNATGDTLTSRVVRWSSSEPGIVDVQPKGTSATIIARAPGGPVTIVAISDSVQTTTTAEVREFYGQLAVGSFQTCVLLARGDTYCWGDNVGGEVGSPGPVDVIVPQRISGDIRFVDISAGDQHTCALTPTGNAYCWGFNSAGQLGSGATVDRVGYAERVAGGLTFRSLGQGPTFHTCALDLVGAAYCWGTNSGGELGNNRPTPSAVRAPVEVLGGERFTAITHGDRHTCALRADGVAFCWGMNADGQLGDGSTTTRTTPTPVSTALTFAVLRAGRDHTCGLTTEGRAYCWGKNVGRFEEGALGDGTTVSRTTPTAVEGGWIFKQLAIGSYTSCGITTDDRALCWGGNFSGSIGDGTRINRLVPTAVAGSFRFGAVAPAFSHSCGVTLDHHVYCWGENHFGLLGDGTTNQTTEVRPVKNPVP